MISRYRSQALTYIKTSFGAYDETVGAIVNSETSYPAAGAVVRSNKTERDGVQQGHEVEVWVDHQTVPWPITSSDRLDYLGRKWKVTEIESYGSGGNGVPIGPARITTLAGSIIATMDGKSIVVQGPNSVTLDFTMYASRVVARAE